MNAPGIIERLGARSLIDVESGPPAPLLAGRLDPSGHTVLFGAGGAGKGTLVSEWIRLLVQDGHRVLIADYENHPDEWARRIDALGGDAVRSAVLYVAPLTSAWQGRRGPFWKHAPELRELIAEWEATVLVVDSIVPACAGTDPMKPESVALFIGGVELIGLPTLALAHVTKADDLRYPFGSVFWHNLSRVTWSLQRDGERSMLVNRKANSYAVGGRYVVEVTYSDDRPVSVWERPYSAVLAERIDEVLAGESRTLAEIVSALNADADEGQATVKANSVTAALNRGRKAAPPRYDLAGGRWSRAS